MHGVSRPVGAAIVVLGLAAPTDAHAIITRDDVPDADYLVDDADFPALVDLFYPGDCIGTLIDPTYLLTVAHCAMDMSPGSVLIVDGSDHEVAEVILHPDWNGWTNDIALIRFVVPVPEIQPMAMYRGSDEKGQQIALLGRGLHATGSVGERGATDDGLLRHATNTVAEVRPQWIAAYFDSPSNLDVTPLEGVGAGGDSGGPAFVDTADGRFIAGLNSWGDAVPISHLGMYGAWDYSTRVSTLADWVDDEIASRTVGPTDVDDTARGPRLEGGAASSVHGRGGCGCATGAMGGRSAIWMPPLFMGVLCRRRRQCPPSPARMDPVQSRSQKSSSTSVGFALLGMTVSTVRPHIREGLASGRPRSRSTRHRRGRPM